MGGSVAAIRGHNGSYKNVAVVPGDANYVDLLARYATNPVERLPPHEDPPTRWDVARYLMLRAQRLLNKALGRPATSDTAIIARMVTKLKAAVESSRGGQTVTAAVLTSPERVKLSDEETSDVLDYLGIQNLLADPDSSWNVILYSTSAAYAGFGNGLCANYTDLYGCEEEEYYMSFERLYHLDYNEVSLSGTIGDVQSVPSFGGAQELFVDTNLGHSHSTSDSQHWSSISQRVHELALSYSRKWHITQLMLTGPNASEPAFKAAVRDALQNLIPPAALEMLEESHDAVEPSSSDDSWGELMTFAPARGAAEVAKRRQEGPIHCAETPKCARQRERLQSSQCQT